MHINSIKFILDYVQNIIFDPLKLILSNVRPVA